MVLLHQLNNLVKGLVGSHQVSDELLCRHSTDAQQDSMLLLGIFHIVRQKILLQTFTVRGRMGRYGRGDHQGYSSSPIVVC